MYPWGADYNIFTYTDADSILLPIFICLPNINIDYLFLKCLKQLYFVESCSFQGVKSHYVSKQNV